MLFLCPTRGIISFDKNALNKLNGLNWGQFKAFVFVFKTYQSTFSHTTRAKNNNFVLAHGHSNESLAETFAVLKESAVIRDGNPAAATSKTCISKTAKRNGFQHQKRVVSSCSFRLDFIHNKRDFLHHHR